MGRNMLCGSFQYWRKLEKRLYFNELQQAEDDTLIGKRRNELSSLQTQLSNSRGRFEDHSCGIKSFPENNVNLWQFWRRPTWQFMMADRGNLRTQIHHGAEGHQHLPEHLAQENRKMRDLEESHEIVLETGEDPAHQLESLLSNLRTFGHNKRVFGQQTV